MNPAAIEKPLINIPLRIIGVFISIAAICGLVDGIALGLGGMESGNIYALSFGLGVLSSYFGLCGAWMRLSMTYSKMSSNKIVIARVLLMFGLLSSVLLSVATIGIFGIPGFYGIFIFIVLSLLGIILLYATPKRF